MKGSVDGPSEHPELWAFLEPLRRGDLLSGTVTAIERYGVFVALDDCPDHPEFPGVGFIMPPELSWRRFEAISDVVRVGQRVSCEFLQFDTRNLEAGLSLRATRPDPFGVFADSITVGRELRGRVIQLAPIGAIVQVADGVEGLIRDLAVPSEVVRVGDEVTVVVTEIDRERRTLALSRRKTHN